jgi:hypothetical protein
MLKPEAKTRISMEIPSSVFGELSKVMGLVSGVEQSSSNRVAIKNAILI